MIYVFRFSPKIWWLNSAYVDPQHRKEAHLVALIHEVLKRAKSEEIQQLKFGIFGATPLALRLS